jgi:DNA-binding SARP family transcriptional activator
MVRVRLFGGLAVEGVDLTTLGSRKARQALARLAVARGAPVSASVLADVVWGDDPPSQPADQLSVLISRLRSVLGAQRLTRGQAGYALHADWLDVGALPELTDEARRRLDRGAVAPANAAAQAALELLRGPVLPEEPEETSWLEAERALAVRHAAAARLVAAEAMLAGGDPWTAASLAQQALAAEPYDESALRALMLAHVAAGRPALALHAYAEIADRLRDELGVDPAPASRDLHLRLLRAEPVSPTGPRTRVGATGPGPGADLYGRDAELATLWTARALADAGQPHLVLVEGEPGIGKTRLLTVFASAQQDTAVLACRGQEHAGGLPLQPLLDALAAYLRSAEHADDLLAGAAAPVRALLGDLRGDLRGGDEADREPAVAALAHDPETGLSRVFAALDTVVGRIAGHAPLLLVLDDIQWADPASRAWLHHAVHRLAGTRLMVLAARRTAEGEAVRADTVLRLGPLDRSAAAAALGLPAGSPEAARLHERSAGNPLFLWELFHTSGTQLPTTIRDSIVERCERAGPAAAGTLRTAAVLGPDVDLELLAAVLTEPVPTLLDHLEEGVRRQVLVESGTGFQFAHQLVREALRSGTTTARAAFLHRQAARCLAERTHGDPLAAAYHARLGGDPVAAARALSRAADIAASRFDVAGARRLLDEAIDLDDSSPELRLRRGRVLLRLDDTAGAAADVRAVRERVSPDEPAYSAALEVAALVAYLDRDFDRCLRLAEEGVAGTRDPETRASCLALAARVRHAVGDLPGARGVLDDLEPVAPASIAPVVDLWRGFLLVHADEPALALRLLAPDEPVSGRVGYPFAAINRHMVAGYALALSGEPAKALAEIDRMTAAAQREGTSRFAGRDDNFRGWILRGVGAFGAADDANARAFERSTTQHLSEPWAHALLDLADGRLRAGDPHGAETYLARLHHGGTDAYLFQWRTDLRLGLVRGRWALAAGDPTGAAAAFTAVNETATALGLRRYLVLSRLWLALARRAVGDRVRAEAIASDVDALLGVAPMEAWWLTAEIAGQFGVDAWHRLAADRAEHLAVRAGPHGDVLRSVAARELGRAPSHPGQRSA